MSGKSTLCLLLVGILTFTLFTACGGNTGNDSSSKASVEAEKPAVEAEKPATESGSDTPASEAEETAAAGDWRTPYKETVKVTIVNSQSAGWKFDEGYDVMYNVWTERWKNTYNIEVETLWSNAEYENQVNLSIASRDIPDMFHCNPVQFYQLRDAGLIADITDVYNEYVSEPVRKRLEDMSMYFDTCWQDGKLYSIPHLAYGAHEAETMWIKNSWYEAAGSPEIKTVAQFEDLMRTFMTEHGSSFAMPANRELWTFYRMSPAWHVFHEIWVDDGTGNIVYGNTLPEQKNQLETWARWYKEGLLRPDWASLDNDAMMADVIDGNVGVLPSANWSGWQWGASIVELYGEDELLSSYEFPSVDGQTIMYPFKFLQYWYNVVSKDCANPEVLIKLNNDYFYVLNISVKEGSMTEAEQLPFSTNDMHHVTGPFKLCHDEDIDVVEVWDVFNRNKTPDFSTGYGIAYYNEISKWVDERDTVGLGRYLQMGSPDAPIHRAYMFYLEDRYVFSKLWGPQPEIMIDLGKVLSGILDEGFAKIINGVEPVDYFETLIEEWKAAGGADVTAAINQMYGG